MVDPTMKPVTLMGNLTTKRSRKGNTTNAALNACTLPFLQQHSVVLMCSEGKPEECHRCKLIGVTLTTQDIPVIHIDENDEQVTQEQAVERLTGGQLSMFGDETFHSRKKYT